MDNERQIEVELQRNFHLLELYSADTTGPIFTQILHDIMALVTTSEGDRFWRLPKFSKINCNVPWATAKLMSVLSSAYM